MIENLQRAEQLMRTGRYAQAEGEVRLYLASDPENGHAHGMLAICLLEQDKLDEAEQFARQSVGLLPDDAFGHRTLAIVLIKRNRIEEARREVDEAILLEPTDAFLFALRGMIALARYRWQEALTAAEEGLALEPGNMECINIQAQALVKLGRKEEATRTISGALARAPDNSDTHANQGWALLHQGQPRQALEHFREALRLDPESDFARAGMVEALKARNFLYRWMLSFFLWMARLPPNVQFGVVIGGYIGVRLLRSAADNNPAIAPFVIPIIVVYVVFAVMTWVSDPLFNLLLRIDRFGRHALSRDQRIGSTVFGIVLAMALLGGIGVVLGLLLDIDGIGILVFLPSAALGIVFGLGLIPVSAIWRCQSGWPRLVMGLYSAGIIAFGLLAFGMLVIDSDRGINLLSVFGIGIFVSQFLANGLVMVRPRR